MKKYALLIICIAITTIIVSANSGFLASFKACSPYTEKGVVNTDGLEVNSKKEISGWQDNKCVYKESTSFSNINSTVTCKFTKAQLNEIASVMQAYDLVQKYSNETVDTSSLESAKNNPVVKVWQKYIQDASVCTISGLDGLNN